MRGRRLVGLRVVRVVPHDSDATDPGSNDARARLIGIRDHGISAGVVHTGWQRAWRDSGRQHVRPRSDEPERLGRLEPDTGPLITSGGKADATVRLDIGTCGPETDLHPHLVGCGVDLLRAPALGAERAA